MVDGPNGLDLLGQPDISVPPPALRQMGEDGSITGGEQIHAEGGEVQNTLVAQLTAQNQLLQAQLEALKPKQTQVNPIPNPPPQNDTTASDNGTDAVFASMVTALENLNKKNVKYG